MTSRTVLPPINDLYQVAGGKRSLEEDSFSVIRNEKRIKNLEERVEEQLKSLQVEVELRRQLADLPNVRVLEAALKTAESTIEEQKTQIKSDQQTIQDLTKIIADKDSQEKEIQKQLLLALRISAQFQLQIERIGRLELVPKQHYNCLQSELWKALEENAALHVRITELEQAQLSAIQAAMPADEGPTFEDDQHSFAGEVGGIDVMNGGVDSDPFSLLAIPNRTGSYPFSDS